LNKPGCRRSAKPGPGHAQGIVDKTQEPPAFLAIARMVRPQGRYGEVLAEILTDFPERFENLRRVLLEDPGRPPRSEVVEDAWFHKGRVVLKFAGVDSIEGAERLRGLHILIPSNERQQLPAGTYYHWELVGCKVIATSGQEPKEVGTVEEVQPAGGAPVLRVEGAGGEVLIPLAQEICTKIDLENRKIFINPPSDLLELNER
jgi:16S rRNA processing protein RimM